MKNQRKPFNWLGHAVALLVLSAGIYFFRHGFDFDRQVSDLFFQGQWLWPKADESLTFWLHDFIKYIFIIIGFICLYLSGVGYYYKTFEQYRFMALLVLLSLVVTPLIIGELKAQTRVFCPSKLERYGGTIPDHYYQLNLPEQTMKQARCFPAAHASPGFALLVLGSGAFTRRRKIIGYLIGCASGSVLSVIQIGRGEHFLTHCIFSALIALWISFLIVHTVIPFIKR